MHIDLKAISGFLVVAYFFIKKWYGEFSGILLPLIQQVEQLSQDGKIDKADRKAIVMKAIDILKTEKKIKLNFIENIIVGKVVDYVAGRLPDFTISQQTEGVISTIVGKMNEQKQNSTSV